jgi:hypothetical protein
VAAHDATFDRMRQAFANLTARVKAVEARVKGWSSSTTTRPRAVLAATPRPS